MRSRWIWPPLFVAAIAVIVIPVHGGAFDLGTLTRTALITAVILPLVLIRLRPGGWVVPLAIVVALLPLATALHNNVSATDFPRQRTHDGGVILTRAAAQEVLHGENPYTTSHRAEIPSYWQRVWSSDDKPTTNPVVSTYPYLPGSFLVHVPFVAAANALGLTWDPRYLYFLVIALAVLAVARLRIPPWQRAAVILGLGTAFTTLYASWGTNDAMVAALVVLAVILAAKRPAWAGVALAVAVSCKFLVLVAVPPLAIVVFHQQGRAALKRWWTLPATLVATGLPFLAMNPAKFVHDTVLFNLGATKVRYPTSGIGLPVEFPGIFHGPLLGLVTVALGILALAGPAWLAHRRPTFAMVGPATALGVACLVIPARTFQQPYLTLIVMLLATGWLVLNADATGLRTHPDLEAEQPRRSATHPSVASAPVDAQPEPAPVPASSRP